MKLKNYIYMLKNRKFQMLLGIALIIFAFYSYPASAWYDNSYQYRTCSAAQNFSIPYARNVTWHTGTGTNNLTDIYFNNHANINLSDVRVIGSNLTAFPLWYNENKLWGNITSNQSGICVYYGNPSAKNISNGSATFRFFDDFNGNLNNWTVHGNSVISNGYTVITGSGVWDTNGLISIYTIGRPAIIDITEYTATGIDAQFFYTNTFTVNTGYVAYKSGSQIIADYIGTTKGSTTFSSNEKDTEKLIINDGTTFDLYRNKTQINTANAGAGEDNYRISAQIFTNLQTFNIDTIKVRQYAKNEPSWIYWGAEEIVPINITAWNNSLTNNQSLNLNFTDFTQFFKVIAFNVTSNDNQNITIWNLNGVIQSSQAAFFSHNFTSNGTYALNATVVSNATGLNQSVNWTILINIGTSNLPIIYIVPTPVSNCSPRTILNLTNLAPTIEPSEPGTGERVNATTYYANNTEFQLNVFAHANSVSETAGVFIYFNNTLVMPQSGRPLGGAEIAYRGVSIIVPRGTFYRVELFNFHHYEWRESKIDLDISGCNYPSNNDSLNNVISGISSGLALLFAIIALATCLKKKRN